MSITKRYEALELKILNGVAIVALNRPNVRNALVEDIKEEWKFFLKEVRTNDEIKVIVLTGNGSAFSAGGDINSMDNLNSLNGRDRIRHSQEIIHLMKELDKPIIASVNGIAAGAGFSLALACDLIIAGKSAVFASSFIKIGLVPDLGGSYLLTQIVGPQIAKRIMLLGEKITAQEALQMNLISYMFDDEELRTRTLEIANRLAVSPSVAIGLTKQLINHSANVHLATVLELEATFQGVCFETDDFQEGVQSFLEKRTPNYIGK